MENRLDDTPTILVVDDEQDIREGSARILKKIGLPVLTASRGEDALEIIKKEKISILFLDLKMPGMDGMEVFGHVREIDPSILVIIITGFATVETAIKAMKDGAYDFIPKPFEPDQLRIVVNRAWEKLRLTWETERLQEEKRRTLNDLDTEKNRTYTIIKSLPIGVVVTNTRGQVVLMNPSFMRLIGLSLDQKPGNRIEDYVSDTGFCDLVREISSGRHVDFEDISDYEFSLTQDKYLLAKGQPVLGERNECLGAVMNITDISPMKIMDQMKSEFVAKVSHELRSPLSTIHEQLALVIREMVGEMSDQDQHILSRAKEKTKGLISLIGDLLDLSRIEEGLEFHEPEPIKVDELLQNIVDFLGTRAKEKDQSLTLELPENPLPPFTADPMALESIFGNLVTNALIYTPEGGEISVKADMAGINIRVVVADNGFGIEAKHLDNIFERFYRVKDDKTRFITGTGLGLPIVKGLVDSFDGFIDVSSEYGKGTAFTVLLPTKSL
ncbi:response regulator [Desulfobacterales bacterium HSG16]|nr:response regulator [Desulfobacterales bacterium HSG16]